jgi:hypothetical protein
VEEDKNDPTNDGMWTKKVQSVSQEDLGPGTAGYSEEDLGKIKKEMLDLVEIYNIEEAAVLCTPGVYQTRHDAKLG